MNEFKLIWGQFSPTAKVPTKDTENAGYDIYVDYEGLGLSEFYTLKPHETKRFDSNIGVVIPSNHVGIVKERSSTGKLTTYVGSGVIDESYRGGLGVFFTNASDEDITLDLKKAIAQMVIFECKHSEGEVIGNINPSEFAEMFPSDRGLGKEGSTGK
jgi:deoxyuridine 5'-triphosphate nucleotidohydrolase